MNITDKVKEIINETVCYDDFQMIRDDHPLFGADGLGIDSLDYFEISSALEEYFDINLDGVNPQMVMSVDKLVAVIEECISKSDEDATTN